MDFGKSEGIYRRTLRLEHLFDVFNKKGAPWVIEKKIVLLDCFPPFFFVCSPPLLCMTRHTKCEEDNETLPFHPGTKW